MALISRKQGKLELERSVNGRILENGMDPLEALVKQASNKKASKASRHNAFGQLVNQFQDTAYQWAMLRLDDPILAQDAVQEGFVVAFQKLTTLREPKAFPGWLRQVIFTQCSRLTRNKQLKTRPIDHTAELPTTDPSPDKTVEEAELKDRVLAAIDELPEKEQEVTQLFYLYGYSQKEISRLLSIPVTTVKKRLQYARGNLRGLLASMFETLYPIEPQPQLEPIPIPVRTRPQYPPQRSEPW